MGKFLIRCYDILFAVLFITVFSWVYLLTWAIIHIVSPGPAIYKARRVGLHGKIFTCYKFRSMRVDSGKVRLTTLQNDDRVFAFGKFIRATKIDEMPQAFNILFGDMSIVGPRPEDEANAANYYIGEYKHILDVKPGLTSPASLYDYTHTPVRDKIAISSMLIQIREFSSHAITHELYIKNRKRLFCL